MTNDLVLHPSRSKQIRLTLVSLVFVVACAAIISTGKQVVVMALGIVLFGLGIPIGIATSLPAGNYLKLTADGFEYRNMFSKPQRLEWSKVEAFSTISNAVTGRAQFVGWRYRSGFGAERRASRFAKALAGVHGQFPNTYGMKPAELSIMLNERLRAALAGD